MCDNEGDVFGLYDGDEADLLCEDVQKCAGDD